MIKTVVFDIDNTLYSFAEGNKSGLDAVASYTREHFGWSRERFDEEHRRTQNEIYTRLNYNGSCRNRLLRYQEMLERNSLPLHIHALHMYHAYWDALLSGITPFEGAAETMRELKKQGITIGVGTDMTVYMQLQKLDRLGVLPFIDFVVSSEEAGKEKPSPAIFSLCCEKAGNKPEECLFVGDHFRKDYRGALSYGMDALWFCPMDRVLTEDEKMESSGVEPENPSGQGEKSEVSRIRKLEEVLAHVSHMNGREL